MILAAALPHVTWGSLNWKPETAFLAGVLIATGLRIWRQGSIWWHHIMDWLIGGIAMSQVPRFSEAISKVTDQPWAGYGTAVTLTVLSVWLTSKGKK